MNRDPDYTFGMYKVGTNAVIIVVLAALLALGVHITETYGAKQTPLNGWTQAGPKRCGVLDGGIKKFEEINKEDFDNGRLERRGGKVEGGVELRWYIDLKENYMFEIEARDVALCVKVFIRDGE